ncbi:MAG: chemotaxis protein CheW [Solirubrobacterales bacterium]
MNKTILTFRLLGRCFGIDIRRVKEINKHIDYTPVPDARPEIVGLMNLRGQIVTIVDLARIMHFPHDPGPVGRSGIILKPVRGDPDHIGFLIDRPGEVLEIQEKMSEPPPANIEDIDVKYLIEVVKMPSELILVIDPDRLIPV